MLQIVQALFTDSYLLKLIQADQVGLKNRFKPLIFQWTLHLLRLPVCQMHLEGGLWKDPESRSGVGSSRLTQQLHSSFNILSHLTASRHTSQL